MDAWAALADTLPEDWPPLCKHLKARCRALPWTTAQQRALERLREDLAARCGEDTRLAVRSSSPEEDLETASFAGGYETRLGVPLDGLEDALRDCAASSLDVRVLLYKMEHGFDDLAPRLAVVVQEQIDSTVAGVAFSLNPVTNDYDEAVIDANWGLGTSVVDGRVSPDHFVVNTVERSVVGATTGEKAVSVRLDAESGIREQEESRAADRTLSDAQLFELTDELCRIEALYKRPVDVEWAYVGDQLHVLQARPITTYVPLPTRPPWARLRMRTVLPRFLRRVARTIASTLWILLAPDRAWTAYREKVDAFETWVSEEIDFSRPLDAFRRRYLAPSARHFFQVTGPAFGAALFARRKERTRFLKRLESQVPSFPPVIDSRGRILRPPSQETDDGFRGMPVSPGVATGPAKVLHAVDEKPIKTGDVLVATTTDPGWTPLFVNAAAIVLEVGGALQHGAVVAREFGKPCVVGLDRATTLLKDGQQAEVDGTKGTVRLEGG